MHFLLLIEVVFPPEGRDAVGPSLSCKGMALTNQPPSVFNSAAAWHAKQQLIERLVHFGFPSAFLLFVLFVVLGSTHSLCTHSKTQVTRADLHFLSSQSNISTLNNDLEIPNMERRWQDLCCPRAAKQCRPMHGNLSKSGLICCICWNCNSNKLSFDLILLNDIIYCFILIIWRRKASTTHSHSHM